MPQDIYKKRRQHLLGQLGDAVALIPTNPHNTRSNDTEFPFRPDSNFAYLTGHLEPEALLVLCPNAKDAKEVLFVRPKNPELELWMGERLGPDKAEELYQVDEAYGFDQLEQKLPELLDLHESIMLDLFSHGQWIEKLYPLMKKLSQQRKRKKPVPQGLHNLAPLIGKMRLKKDAHEIELMKKAAQITHEAHCAAMARAAEGVSEGQVQSVLDYVFMDRGAQGEAYESIVAGGNNANTLHYIENNQALKNGDLLLIDAGCELDLYASDVTRTFPVSGRYTPMQKKVYELILDVQKKCIEMAAPGVSLSELHEFTCKGLSNALLELGFFKGKTLDQVVEEKLYRTYFPHGTGHWLGLDVHDTCPYFDENYKDIKFEEGMVFTVEPGLYFNKVNEEVPTELKGIGIRIEDDILITSKGHENLTASIPKEVDEVEKACQKNYKELL